jgi:hypothetical protein
MHGALPPGLCSVYLGDGKYGITFERSRFIDERDAGGEDAGGEDAGGEDAGGEHSAGDGSADAESQRFDKGRW